MCRYIILVESDQALHSGAAQATESVGILDVARIVLKAAMSAALVARTWPQLQCGVPMPNEVILFGGSVIAIAALTTLVATLLMHWAQTPLPSFRPVPSPSSSWKRLRPW
jgi:hypothetical protein